MNVWGFDLPADRVTPGMTMREAMAVAAEISAKRAAEQRRECDPGHAPRFIGERRLVYPPVVACIILLSVAIAIAAYAIWP